MHWPNQNRSPVEMAFCNLEETVIETCVRRLLRCPTPPRRPDVRSVCNRLSLRMGLPSGLLYTGHNKADAMSPRRSV